MEVDIAKLQHLNDRIAQTIDVLNHLRATTVGLSHSASVGAWSQIPQVGFQSNPWGMVGHNPILNQGWNVNPYGQIGLSPFMGGLRHSADPYAFASMNPYGIGGFGVNSGYGMSPNFAGVNNGFGGNVGQLGLGLGLPYGMAPQGLSHAGMIDPRFSVGFDPRVVAGGLQNTMRPYSPFPTFGMNY